MPDSPNKDTAHSSRRMSMDPSLLHVETSTKLIVAFIMIQNVQATFTYLLYIALVQYHTYAYIPFT